MIHVSEIDCVILVTDLTALSCSTTGDTEWITTETSCLHSW